MADFDGEAVTRLVLCDGFERTAWGLPIVAGRRLLVGWSSSAPSREGGVPAPVAELLATALARHATLTFATGRAPGRLASMFSRRPRLGRDFGWTSTRDAGEAARGIFAGEAFSWDLQAQVVVLSGADAPPPALDERHLELAREPALLGEIERAGASGALLPGVDGDVAGLYAFRAEDLAAWRNDLAALASAAGLACDAVDEAAFARALAAPGV